MDPNEQAKPEESSNMKELNELTKDYTRYLHVDALKERQSFYDSIEEMLTKLDEFGGLVDMIRSDTNLCVNENVPRIQMKCEEMKKLFARIDQLEAFVGVVRQNINATEELVSKAEQDMGSFSVKNFFSSLLGQKKSAQAKDAKPTFSPPEIFVTEDYLMPELPAQELPKDSDAEKQKEENVAEQHDTDKSAS